MKKVIWKRLIAMLLVTMIIITISGCNYDKKQGMYGEEDVIDMTYELEVLEIDGIQGEICSYLVKNDKLYLHTYEVVSDNEESLEEAGTEVLRFYCSDLDGSNLQEIKFGLSEREYLSSVGIEEKGTFIGLISTDSQIDNGTNMDLVRLNEDGKELLRTNIIETLKLKEDTLTSRIFLDDKDNILLVGNSKLYILDQNFELKNEVKIEDGWQLADIALAKNGQIVCVESEQNSMEMVTRVRSLDIEKGSWGEKIKLDCNSYLGSVYIMDGIDADLYYKGVSGIYSYDIASDKSTKMLDYEASYLSVEEADGIVPMGNGKFLGLMQEENGENHGLAVYSKVDPARLANKQTITYGGLWVNETIKNEIVAFNKKNKDYKIEIKEYYQEEDPIAKLNADIITGNAPDIFNLSDLPVEKYVELGLLEDLTLYFEKDTEINADDMVDSLAEAMNDTVEIIQDRVKKYINEQR